MYFSLFGCRRLFQTTDQSYISSCDNTMVASQSLIYLDAFHHGRIPKLNVCFYHQLPTFLAFMKMCCFFPIFNQILIKDIEIDIVYGAWSGDEVPA